LELARYNDMSSSKSSFRLLLSFGVYSARNIEQKKKNADQIHRHVGRPRRR
jgi:hypothetical protein